MEPRSTLVVFGRVNREGALDLDVPRRWIEVLRSFAGRRVLISVEDEPAKRTPQQNRYYHGYLVRPIAEHQGEFPSKTHDDLKAKWGIASTADLSPREFEQFCEEIRAWAATDLGMNLREPGEVNLERETPYVFPGPEVEG